jgi:hypothetical protein
MYAITVLTYNEEELNGNGRIMGQTIRTIPDGDLTLPKGRDRLAAITAFTMSVTFITLSPRSQTSQPSSPSPLSSVSPP